MRDDINYKYEVFNIHYNKAQKYKELGNLKAAKTEYLLAAKKLLEVAGQYSGELQVALHDRATRILSLANSIDSSIYQEAKSKSDKKVDKKIRSDAQTDQTETIWQTADIPKISLSDVAGLDNVKKSIEMRVLLPMKHPDVYKKFDKKSGGGVLLYGLPGTGKTMIAKAIAHEAKAAFYSVKCSDVVSKWVGESERNIRNLFDAARQNDRAVIFFDEFESLATKRGGNSTVMNRLVPELLAQIQGFKEEENKLLLLLAATNRPWDIDSAMLRPGRFNELIYVPLPDYKARLFIIKKMLSKLPIDNDVSLEDIAEKLDGYNGADIEEFCERLKDGPVLRTIANGGTENITINDVIDTFGNINSSVRKSDIIELEKFINNHDK